MYALVFILILAVEPSIDHIDDLLFGGRQRGYVGEIVIWGNEQTGFDPILEGILARSADRIRPWKFVVSEWLLLCQHYEKFDVHSNRRPRIRLLDGQDQRDFRTVVVDFPETTKRKPVPHPKQIK